MSEHYDCAPCGGEQEFHRLPCVDGHDEDCPEVVCTGCGSVQTREPGPLAAEPQTLRKAA